jgi:hypothetical protein
LANSARLSPLKKDRTHDPFGKPSITLHRTDLEEADEYNEAGLSYQS